MNNRYIVFYEAELAETSDQYPEKKGLEGQSVIFTDKEPETQEDYEEIYKFIFDRKEHKKLTIRRIAEWPLEGATPGDTIEGEVLDKE